MTGANQPEQDGKMPEFVERRRAALERYLNRTATHPIFQVDPDFRDFLECGNLETFSSICSFFYTFPCSVAQWRIGIATGF